MDKGICRQLNINVMNENKKIQLDKINLSNLKIYTNISTIL
jgi:hypothetical protein